MLSPAVKQKLKHDAVIPVILSTYLDRGITLLFFEHEANSLVTALGPYLWLLLTSGLLLGLYYLWYSMRLYRFRISLYCAYGLTSITSIAILSNVYYLTTI